MLCSAARYFWHLCPKNAYNDGSVCKKTVSPYQTYEFWGIKSYCKCFITEYYQIPLFLDISDDVSIIDDDVTGEANENTTES